DFSDAKALEILYGNYDPALRVSYWGDVVTPPGPNHDFLVGEYNKGAIVRPFFSQPFREGDAEKRFLLTQMVPRGESDYQCHACSPLVGGAIFVHRNGTWIPEREQLAIAQYGGWGEVPKAPKLVRIGPAKMGVLLEEGNVA